MSISRWGTCVFMQGIIMLAKQGNLRYIYQSEISNSEIGNFPRGVLLNPKSARQKTAGTKNVQSEIGNFPKGVLLNPKSEIIPGS